VTVSCAESQIAEYAASYSSPSLSYIWARIKDHKVAQWTLAYAAAAYTLLHIVEMVSEALDWPHLIPRIVTLSLFLGAPVAATIAWYHGHKTRHRVSGAELAILSVLLFIAGSVLWFFGRPAQEHVSPSQAPTASSTLSASAPPEKSIAVLPFLDLSEKHDQEYFADGMAEEIADLLARIPAIRVISRTSSFQFKGHSEDLRTLGAKLGVAHVLEGSVRTSGDRVRVTAQLVDVNDASQRWSGSYDRDLVDVLKVQDEISWGLVRALEVSMGADEPRRPSLKSVDAYALYLRGRHAFGRYDKAGFDQAASYFRQAMELDPDSALVPAWLALVYFNFASFGLVQPDTGYEEARRYAERARMLDPQSELAAAVLGAIYVVHDWNWAGGKAELDRALTLAPGNARIILFHSIAPIALGQWEDSLRDQNTSVALDPLYAPGSVTAALRCGPRPKIAF